MSVDITIQETIDLVDITVNPNIIEVNVTRTSGGGGGTQTLEQTLILGQRTGGKNIIVDDADAVELNNGSLLKKGTYSFEGVGGGISRICSVGYEDMWQSGIRYVFDNNGEIRHATNGFNTIPDFSFDKTLRFKVDSLWTLDDGTTYVCTDASVGAAVWEIYHSNVPSLQEVVNVGDLPINQVSAGSRYFELLDKSRLNFCFDNQIIFTFDDLVEFPIGTNFNIWSNSYDTQINSSDGNSLFYGADTIGESGIGSPFNISFFTLSGIAS